MMRLTTGIYLFKILAIFGDFEEPCTFGVLHNKLYCIEIFLFHIQVRNICVRCFS